VALVTVIEAAKQLNRSPESVRKLITARRITKYYDSGALHRFRVEFEDVARVYREVEAAGR
jgi:hypothetical protein